jgi:transcription elongation factor Elf1
VPNYTFECHRCGHQKHEFLSLAEHEEYEPVHCKKPMYQVLSAPQIVKDIDPYSAVATDIATGKAPRIGSRREHREFLRRNDLVEVGTQPISSKREVRGDFTTGRDVKKTIEQLRHK